jgi:hypothetical protein
MWVHCHAVALTTALTPCWRGLAATEEPLKVVSGARVREGRNASDQHANCKVFENRPRGHLTRTTGTYPHKHRGFYVGAPLGGVLAKALTIGKALTRGSGSYQSFVHCLLEHQDWNPCHSGG